MNPNQLDEWGAVEGDAAVHMCPDCGPPCLMNAEDPELEGFQCTRCQGNFLMAKGSSLLVASLGLGREQLGRMMRQERSRIPCKLCHQACTVLAIGEHVLHVCPKCGTAFMAAGVLHALSQGRWGQPLPLEVVGQPAPSAPDPLFTSPFRVASPPVQEVRPPEEPAVEEPVASHGKPPKWLVTCALAAVVAGAIFGPNLWMKLRYRCPTGKRTTLVAHADGDVSVVCKLDAASTLSIRFAPQGWKREVENWVLLRRHGTATLYHRKNVKALEGEYKEDQKEGRWLSWWEDGSIREELHYEHGILHGSYAAYASTGTKVEVGRFDSGMRDGAWTRYNADGKPAEQTTYRLGKELGKVTIKTPDALAAQTGAAPADPVDVESFPVAEHIFGGQKVAWWRDRLTRLRSTSDGNQALYQLTLQRARAAGLDVKEKGETVEVMLSQDLARQIQQVREQPRAACIGVSFSLWG